MSKTPLNEIREDQATPASDVGDLAFAKTKGDEITKNNSLQGHKKPEVSLEDHGGVSYPSWFEEVMPEADEETKGKKPKEPSPRIPKVSCELADSYRNCYYPEVVSIGPYHYSEHDGKLSKVEKLKAPMTRQFVEACARDGQTSRKDMLRKLYTEVKGMDEDARLSYNKSIVERFDKEAFLKMMFIDGCFILQFIDCIFRKKKLEMNDRQVASVKRDLLLLENQLPFPILKSLMNVRYKRKHEGMDIIDYFLHLQIFGARLDDPNYIKSIPLPRFRILQREVQKASGEDNQPAHLLELLYSKFMGSKNGTKLIPGNTASSTQVSSGHYLYYSAKNLKRVGIQFQPSWSGALTYVEFMPSIFFGTMKLHRIGIHKSTKELLLNLVAYEESTSPSRSWVASYICLMDSLINDAEDVEELRSKGILVNYLGADQQVASLFNQAGRYLKPDASTYDVVKREINKQCESRISKWVAEWKQKYFGSPWTIIAVLAAAFGLA